jgi:hypothetical protein
MDIRKEIREILREFDSGQFERSSEIQRIEPDKTKTNIQVPRYSEESMDLRNKIFSFIKSIGFSVKKIDQQAKSYSISFKGNNKVADKEKIAKIKRFLKKNSFIVEDPEYDTTYSFEDLSVLFDPDTAGIIGTPIVLLHFYSVPIVGLKTGKTPFSTTEKSSGERINAYRESRKFIKKLVEEILNEYNRFLVRFKDGTETTIKVPEYANASKYILGSFKKEIESFEKIGEERY